VKCSGVVRLVKVGGGGFCDGEKVEKCLQSWLVALMQGLRVGE